MNATINNATANNQSLPRDVETLVEHLWITVDGEEVQRIQNYNQVFRTLWDSEQSYDDNRKRAMLSSGAYILNGLNSTAYDYANRPVCMTKWYGLLGSKSLLDTRLTGPVIVHLHFAPNTVLVSTNAASNYSLSDLAMTALILPDTTLMPRTI